MPAFSPEFLTAFSTALIATAKVFAVGLAGFWLVWRKVLKEDGLAPLGLLVANLTLPCQIFHRFAVDFDPRTFPGWPNLVLMGAGVTLWSLVFGKMMARRWKTEEATMLIGFQNAGFFVLPMLQALLPPSEFGRAALMLFVFIIPFNAAAWPAGSWFLLHKRQINWKLLFAPPTLAVAVSLVVFGLFHKAAHFFEDTTLWRVLFGDHTPGAVQLVGDLTIPLATLVLGGSIAATLGAGWSNIPLKRAAVEVSLVKLVVVPFFGFWLLKFWPWGGLKGNHFLWLLLMLQFASPPAMATAVFCRQNGFVMRLVPAACLVSYLFCLATIPFWVALVPK